MHSDWKISVSGAWPISMSWNQIFLTVESPVEEQKAEPKQDNSANGEKDLCDSHLAIHYLAADGFLFSPL